MIEILQQTLIEEGAADHRLTEIAATVNVVAVRLVQAAGFMG